MRARATLSFSRKARRRNRPCAGKCSGRQCIHTDTITQGRTGDESRDSTPAHRRQELHDRTRWASSPMAAERHEFKNQTPINSKEPIMEAREHPHREAWNKGSWWARRHRSNPRTSGPSVFICRTRTKCATSPCSTSRSTANSEGCDLVSLRVRDVTHGNQVLSRAMVVQRKTQRPVQFELTEPTRTAVAAWIAKAGLRSEDFLLSEPPARLTACLYPSVREDRRALGGGRRPRSVRLRYALDATHEGDIDLQAHEEPAGGATPAGSLQARVDGAVLGHRGR